MSCRDVRDWLHREAEALAESQRLVLDDHLAVCERCRGDRARMRLVHRAGTSLQVPSANAREYNRAIARALLEGAPRREPDPARKIWLVPVLAAAGLAAVIAFVIANHSEPEHFALEIPPPMNPLTRPTPYLPDPPAPRADVVEDGVLEHAAANLAAGDLVPADTPLRTTKRARVRLASARIVIAASSELRWVAVDRTILLDRGSIDVESGAAGVARIVVKGFEVTVGDADVVVEPRSVHVRRGVVRVNGTELVAGTTWTPERKAPAKPGPAISEVLSRARAELAARNMDAAVRLASSVTSRSPSRAQLAEAQTILADVSLATGLLDDAAARYLGVAATFQDLPTAESAFYAAIRVRLRQHKPSARDLLEQYIARYPNGRYLLDARRQLATLGGSR